MAAPLKKSFNAADVVAMLAPYLGGGNAPRPAGVKGRKSRPSSGKRPKKRPTSANQRDPARGKRPTTATPFAQAPDGGAQADSYGRGTSSVRLMDAGEPSASGTRFTGNRIGKWTPAFTRTALSETVIYDALAVYDLWGDRRAFVPGNVMKACDFSVHLDLSVGVETVAGIIDPYPLFDFEQWLLPHMPLGCMLGSALLECRFIQVESFSVINTGIPVVDDTPFVGGSRLSGRIPINLYSVFTGAVITLAMRVHLATVAPSIGWWNNTATPYSAPVTNFERLTQLSVPAQDDILRTGLDETLPESLRWTMAISVTTRFMRLRIGHTLPFTLIVSPYMPSKDTVSTRPPLRLQNLSRRTVEIVTIGGDVSVLLFPQTGRWYFRWLDTTSGLIQAWADLRSGISIRTVHNDLFLVPADYA